MIKSFAREALPCLNLEVTTKEYINLKDITKKF